MSKEGITVYYNERSEANPPFDIRYSKFCGSAVCFFLNPERWTLLALRSLKGEAGNLF
jgi:hypothetical protein